MNEPRRRCVRRRPAAPLSRVAAPLGGAVPVISRAHGYVPAAGAQ
jgi:hypothetical protein